MLALAVIASTPLWAMTTPVLVDLPAHVARYHIQQFIHETPALADYFVYEWRFLPNMGMDLLVAALAPLLGVESATQAITAMLPALIVLAMLLVAREVHGRLPWTALFALPLAYAYPFVFGFVNYWLSAGLALLGLFICLRLTHRGKPWLRTVVLSLLSPLVMVSHVAGFGLLGVMCFGALLGNALEKEEALIPAALRAGIACVPLAWPAILLFLWKEPSAGWTGYWFPLWSTVVWTVGMLRTRWAAPDIASAALICAVALLPFLSIRRRSWSQLLRIQGWQRFWSLKLLVPAVLLGALALLLPRQINGSDYASVRLIPFAFALAVLSVRRPGWGGRLGPAIGLAFFATRTLLLLVTMTQASHAAERELSGLDHVRQGARVAAFNITHCGPFWEPRYLIHIQAMATTRRNAMVNDNFAQLPGQLLRLTAREQQVAQGLLTSNDARGPVCGREDTIEFADAYRHVDLSRVDYLWIIDTVGMSWRHDPRLRQVWSNGGSAIFEVVH